MINRSIEGLRRRVVGEPQDVTAADPDQATGPCDEEEAQGPHGCYLLISTGDGIAFAGGRGKVSDRPNRERPRWLPTSAQDFDDWDVRTVSFRLGPPA